MKTPEKSRSQIEMPPPTAVPKNSKSSKGSQKATKPPRLQDPNEKKKRPSLAESGAMEEDQIADHVELPEGITFDEFRKMDIFLTEDGITEFCRQVSDVRGFPLRFFIDHNSGTLELEKAVAFMDEQNAALEKDLKTEECISKK